MVAIDSQEIPEDFPLATFVSLMGEFGQVDARMYETVREESKIAAERRRIELEEEEKKRQIEAEQIDEESGDPTPDNSPLEQEASAEDSAQKSESEISEQPSKASDEANPPATVETATAVEPADEK